MTQHIDYPYLDGRIAQTYVARGNATSKAKLYDSYIRAIRWGSDRLGDKGVLAYVTNGGWVDANTSDGMRKSMADEFSSIYIFHLRGNQRTSGETSKREGGKIFGAGSRAPIVISLFVKNPQAEKQGEIFFHDIGDYMSREDKLKIVKDFRSIRGIADKRGWQKVIPDDHGDWIKQRDDSTSDYISIGAKKEQAAASLFETFSLGVSTSRDTWCFNASRGKLDRNIRRTIAYYNRRLDDFVCAYERDTSIEADAFLGPAPRDISWSWGLRDRFARQRPLSVDEGSIVPSIYRPFFRQWLHFNRELINRVYQIPRIFPEPMVSNRAIAVAGVGHVGTFSTLMLDRVPTLEVTAMKGGSQCFPLTVYDQVEG